MISAERHSWNWEDTKGLQLQFREPRALEYIAYYLDRIEQHLAQSAATNAQIQSSLAAIAHLMPSIVKAINQ